MSLLWSSNAVCRFLVDCGREKVVQGAQGKSHQHAWITNHLLTCRIGQHRARDARQSRQRHRRQGTYRRQRGIKRQEHHKGESGQR